MAKLVLKMIVSLDGFVARPDGTMDWMGDSNDPEMVAWELATLWNAQAHLMGGGAAPAGVPSFVRKWRARRDSNS